MIHIRITLYYNILTLYYNHIILEYTFIIVIIIIKNNNIKLHVKMVSYLINYCLKYTALLCFCLHLINIKGAQ